MKGKFREFCILQSCLKDSQQRDQGSYLEQLLLLLRGLGE